MAKKVIIKTAKQIDAIRESCKYLTEMLYLLKDEVKPWVSLLELELFSDQFLKKRNLKGAFNGYDGFPANLCLSVNDCVVHGIPDDYVLKNGDVLKIDSWVIYNWGISDAAISVIVGGGLTNPLWNELVIATKKALDLWLQQVVPWESMYNFSKTVYDTVHGAGFSVIKNLTGHGVGVKVHEAPHIYNYPVRDMGKQFFKPWMVVALEPITAIKSDDIVLWNKNDWNLYCKKWDIGAQWEYSILITENGYEVLAGIQEDLY